MQKDKPGVPAEVKNAVTKKRKGQVHNPQKDFGQEYIMPGDNAKYIRHALGNLNLPPINLNSDEQVQERITWYFNRCIESDLKPTVVGLANSLGVDRCTLHDWKVGKRRGKKDDRTAIISRAYSILEELWEDYMLNGKVNPVSGIFIGKNHFGYSNKSEVIVRPESPLGELESPEEVQNRYIESAVDEGE